MLRQLVFWFTLVLALTVCEPAQAYPAAFPSATLSPAIATAIPRQTLIPMQLQPTLVISQSTSCNRPAYKSGVLS